MTEKKDEKFIEKARHSLSHVLAMAVREVFPEVKFAIGPAIENGFYYDFELPRALKQDDLVKLEKVMREIIESDLPIIQSEKDRKAAIEYYKELKQPFKVELVENLSDEKVGFFTIGDFDDLCKGPHVESTGKMKNLGWKIDKIAGAYWRGDEKRPMLQRIYGLAFESSDDMKKYEEAVDEAEKRDHRKLGRELDLFIFSDLVGPGLPLYTPKGAKLRQIIADYSRSLREEIGYQEVHTPNINKAELFKISGHYDKYKDDMFEVKSHYTDEEYYLKPMNCPQHTQIFASQMRSYKDMPVRIADFANLYRDEKPGELNGLVRLRAFSQDDGHCFCREDQIEAEFSAILGVIEKCMKKYEMEYYIRLSLRDENKKDTYLGDDAVWEKSQKLLEKLLLDKKIEYRRAEGDAAFYGPKMDLVAKDSLGREYQLSTIQLDFNMPTRFKLEYTDEKGEKKTPVMIHSALVGSPERFMGILVEHYAGAFPVWLAPIQAIILPIADRHFEYAKSVEKELKDSGIRVELDQRTESVGRKIREAEMQKVPYMVILGDKEIEAKKISIRKYGEGDKGQIETVDLIKEINNA